MAPGGGVDCHPPLFADVMKCSERGADMAKIRETSNLTDDIDEDYLCTGLGVAGHCKHAFGSLEL